VEAEWPDGTIEIVSTFKAGLDALDWVKRRSAAWMAERADGAPAERTCSAKAVGLFKEGLIYEQLAAQTLREQQ
jgi:hypothetical protein